GAMPPPTRVAPAMAVTRDFLKILRFMAVPLAAKVIFWIELWLCSELLANEGIIAPGALKASLIVYMGMDNLSPRGRPRQRPRMAPEKLIFSFYFQWIGNTAWRKRRVLVGAVGRPGRRQYPTNRQDGFLNAVDRRKISR